MKFKGLFLIAAILCLAACSQSLNDSFSKGLTAASSSDSTGGSASDGQSAPADLWAGVDLMGMADNTTYGFQGLKVDKTNKTLQLIYSFPYNIFGFNSRFNIKNIPGAYVEIAPGVMDSGFSLVINMPLEHFVRGLDFVGPITLPNGNPLSGVPGGEPPRFSALATADGDTVLYVYGSQKYFAAFVPTPGFDTHIDFTFPIKNESKTRVLGYFSFVAERGNHDGGMFISAVFTPEFTRTLNNLFK